MPADLHVLCVQRVAVQPVSKTHRSCCCTHCASLATTQWNTETAVCRRFSPKLLENPHLARAQGATAVYLDTTYCNPRHTFPPQASCPEPSCTHPLHVSAG